MKTRLQNDIPTRSLKEISEVYARHFRKIIKFGIENSVFPSYLKLAHVSPAFKEKSKDLKTHWHFT